MNNISIQQYKAHLLDKLPRIVTRKQALEATGNLYSPRTLTNMESRNEGPRTKMKIGRQVAYPVKTSLISSWVNLIQPCSRISIRPCCNSAIRSSPLEQLLQGGTLPVWAVCRAYPRIGIWSYPGKNNRRTERRSNSAFHLPYAQSDLLLRENLKAAFLQQHRFQIISSLAIMVSA